MMVRTIGAVFLLSALPWSGVHTAGAGDGIWTTRGPEGGTILALAIDPRAPATLYAATWNEGVFKSTDGGLTWINTGVLDAGVGCLAIDPWTAGTLYAGTYNRGVFKSTDGGGNWTAVNTGLTNAGVVALAIDPVAPATVYAGTLTGVFKSTDGGASWIAVNTGLPSGRSVSALAIDPQATATLYAGTNTVGVFKTTDGGTHWTAVNTGLTAGRVYQVAVDPQTPTTLYVAGSNGVFKSTNAGESWQAVNTGLGATYTYALAVDRQTPTTLYAGTAGGVFKSTDGGNGWSAVNSGLTTIDVLALVIDPAAPATLYAGTKFPYPGDWNRDTGVFKSTNGGGHWIPMNRGLVATSAVGLAIDPQVPATLYATTGRGVFKSTDGASSWGAVNTGLTTPFVLPLAIDPQTPTTVYVGARGAFQSTDGGGSWSAITGLSDLLVNALAIDPQAPATLYAGTDRGLFKSTDGASNWMAADMGLGDRARVSSLTIDPQVPATIYAGAYDLTGTYAAGTFKSTDGGATWSRVNPMVLAVAVHPFESSTLYGYSYDGVFKSTDGGASWSTGVAGLGPVALVMDPQSPETLYAGTYGGGVFTSTDGGATWSDFSQGLTNPWVHALAIAPQGSTLYAGTNGGVFSITMTRSLTLTIGTTGDGAGTVSSDPAGIDCGADCSESYPHGATVTLTAIPAPGSVFSGWSGSDTEDGPTCRVTMAAEASVTARFDLERFPLRVSTGGLGRGTVTSDPSGINCGSDCSEGFVRGIAVSLTATPALGSIFTAWKGCDAVSGRTCTVSMNAARSVTAYFLGLPFSRR